MTIARWSPARELARLQEEFVRSFMPGESLEASFARGAWEPTVDISETNDNYVINADLPGLSKEDLKVSYKDGILSIQGEKKQEKKEKGKTYHRVERSYGTFERSFRLPARVQVEKVDAKFKDGVLTLTSPKAEEVRPKEIPIKVN